MALIFQTFIQTLSVCSSSPPRLVFFFFKTRGRRGWTSRNPPKPQSLGFYNHFTFSPPYRLPPGPQLAPLGAWTALLCSTISHVQHVLAFRVAVFFFFFCVCAGVVVFELPYLLVCLRVGVLFFFNPSQKDCSRALIQPDHSNDHFRLEFRLWSLPLSDRDLQLTVG